MHVNIDESRCQGHGRCMEACTWTGAQPKGYSLDGGVSSKDDAADDDSPAARARATLA